MPVVKDSDDLGPYLKHQKYRPRRTHLCTRDEIDFDSRYEALIVS